MAVLGNCQGVAVSSAMRLLLPGAAVDDLSVHRLDPRFRDGNTLARHLAGYDVVFASRFSRPLRDGTDLDALRARVPLVQMPIVVFGAFHPDVVYVETRESGRTGLASGPMGHYHSALVLFAHRQGWAPERTRRLFDAAVFRRLGYLDMWNGAAGTLLELGREAGHPLEADLLRWTRRGAFMHVVNHPRMFVASDIARTLLARAGLPIRDCDLDTFLPDVFLRLGSWPVDPAVGETYGLSGSRVFMTPAGRRRPARALSLETFVAESLAAFAPHGAGTLGCERVDGWLGSPDLVDDLRRMTA